MDWYSTRARFISRLDGEVLEDALCEWVLYLVLADSEEAARAKGHVRGLANESSYKNDAGQVVTWEFQCIEEVQSLDESALYDGIEVYSRLYRGVPDND